MPVTNLDERVARDSAARASGSRLRWTIGLTAGLFVLAGAIYLTTLAGTPDPEAGNRVSTTSSGKETPVVVPSAPVAAPNVQAGAGAPNVETSEATPVPEPAAPAAHPLDPALDMARKALAKIDGEIHDYTARVVMQERVDGKLVPESEVFVKIRHERKLSEDVTLPFGIYMRYDGPPKWKGREVIWVDGWHDGNLVAHEAGLLNLLTAYLDPEGEMAMMASRYPIYEIGMRKLVQKLIERGERERATDVDNCLVTEERGVDLNGRTCRVIRVRHPERRPDLEFSLAEIFVDEETELPIRYAGYAWGENPGDPEILLEQYTYLDVKTNVGVADADFMTDNEEYNFP